MRPFVLQCGAKRRLSRLPIKAALLKNFLGQAVCLQLLVKLFELLLCWLEFFHHLFF